MLNLTFSGELTSLQKGLSILADELGICLSENAFPVKVKKQEDKGLCVSCSQEGASISYSDPCCFFRAFGLLVQHLNKGETVFSLTEPMHFDMNGPMFDMSQGNAALNVKTVKDILRQLSLMGMNTLMLYCEDTYEVKNQPYFGYMRARYSEEDMKELDDYAYDLGIEMIPCIQTLAHLQDPLRWHVFDDIRDYDACLLVGEEKTYQFVEDLITAATKPFRTKKIHIGMDEAWQLGRGKYLTLNGYTDPSQLMRYHLARVMGIVNKLGLQPMMWDDMFFRVFGDMSYYQDTEVPDHVKAMVPENMGCIYWDYYHNNKEEYEALMKRHLELTDNVIFAGGCWTWTGFTFSWEKTKLSTRSALTTCKKLGIRKVFMTTWGDNGTEMPVPVTLMGAQLFAEYGYSDTFDPDADYETFKERFAFCTGGNTDDFMNLEYLDRTPDTEVIEDKGGYNTAKSLMWQDILTGLVDKNYEDVPLSEHYSDLTAKLTPACSRNGRFNDIFAFLTQASVVLSQKGDMGLRLTEAYLKGDKAALSNFAECELPALKEDVIMMRSLHRKVWFDVYKPLGWDVMDMRYGSLIARITSAEEEITDYLEGRLEKLEELEQERLYFHGKPGPVNYNNYYHYVASPSRIAALG